MDELPDWTEVSTLYSGRDVVNIKVIADMPHAPEYAALRSYATGRREHALYGPMPPPVARFLNRRLWLKADIVEWLTCPLPAWKRNRHDVARWIAAGRPRTIVLAGTERGADGATLPPDGRSTPTP